MQLDKKIVDGLVARAEKGDTSVLRSTELKSLFEQIKTLEDSKRAQFGKEINELKKKLEEILADKTSTESEKPPIDVTAPWEVNTPPEKRPATLLAEDGSRHPLMSETEQLIDIFTRMGFSAVESRQIDDDWNMFTSLNFPEGHPARDDYDTFIVEEKDKDGNNLIAPAHTSTMQNRVLKENRHLLETGEPIAYIIPGRVFRNEDVDATHDHTFYQLEGLYVDKGVNTGHLIATLRAFLEEYFGQKLRVKTQPFYFPFTEPSFEFAIEKPKSLRKYTDGSDEWLELLGCGMIHPNVLRAAGIDPKIYTGFAWGGGIDRLVMMKYGIEDIRHFHSGRLNFLRQFK
ncbi:MAG TPA: phenylalanine--tRNA ligase subunit alpha [Candidatus Saccharimonadales bacterium]|nr:phenylalanine--tRNA ligase subunit alpha [Candidatus Saccharimonadales bacterium]